MNNFSFKLGVGRELKVEQQGDLILIENERFSIYYNYLPEAIVVDLLKLSTNQQIIDWFSQTEEEKFIVFVHSKLDDLFFAFNDVFGYQQIFIHSKNDNLYIRSYIEYDNSETYNLAALYELISFQSVVPPQTVINNVELVPLSHYVQIDTKLLTWDYHKYWNIESKFKDKYSDYEKLTVDLREAFKSTINKTSNKKSSVALSGGIDSGCILGILSESNQHSSLPSFSYGAQGVTSTDLESARKTAQHFDSPNTEIYPSQQTFIDLVNTSRQLQLPISGEVLVVNAQLQKIAKASGATQIYFGFGTQMLLGNLPLNILWHKIRVFEKLFPQKFCHFVYKCYFLIKRDCSNARNVLLAKTWEERFVYKLGPLFTREKKVFKALPDNFLTKIVDRVAHSCKSNELSVSDKIVTWYFFSWINYIQARNSNAVGSIMGVEAILPYNTPKVAKVIAKSPDIFRKKNNWDKQVWRDAVKPYVPPHLYKRKGRSLSVQYDKLLLPHADCLIACLEKNLLLKQVIDFDILRSQLSSLPEPGLFLLRLSAIAAWHEGREGHWAESCLSDCFSKVF